MIDIFTQSKYADKFAHGAFTWLATVDTLEQAHAFVEFERVSKNDRFYHIMQRLEIVAPR